MTCTTATTPAITDLALSLRRGETSATELARTALDRIAALNGALNAFVLVDEAGALAAAATADDELAAGLDRGPLHGVPVAVKDLIDMAGLPTSCGSASSFGAANAGRDAEIVTRLRRAGAVIVGKNTLHEFAYGATGDRSAHGPSRNPHDVRRISGGSSGGSAVAVAAGLVPLSVGTDTAGSVRVPAALCGVVGFKPSFDALPTEGVYALAPTLDHVGLFATNTADIALAYDALTTTATDEAPPIAALSVGWIPPNEIAVTDARVEAQAHRLLVDAGLDPVTVHGVAPEGDAALFDILSTLQRKEAFHVHEQHIEKDWRLVDAEVLTRLLSGRHVSTVDYDNADRARRAFRARVIGLLQTHSVLALPTTPITAPIINERSVCVGDTDLEIRSVLLSLTAPWNLAGVPALSVPAGTVDGLPVGVQLVTAPGREARLFALARRLEAARARVQPTPGR
jgi:aspartyl-tRNA(Asn)/glutamyl-tRNA(Gln) amidotransferase subunit A